MHIHIPGLYFEEAVREEFAAFEEDLPQIAAYIKSVRTAAIEGGDRAHCTHDCRIFFDPAKLHPDDGWTERGLRHVANHEMGHVIYNWFGYMGLNPPALRIGDITHRAKVSTVEKFCEVWAIYRTNPDAKTQALGEKIIRRIERVIG